MSDRKSNISKCLSGPILKDLADLTSNYDYLFEGKSTHLGKHYPFICCIAELPCGKIISGSGATIKIWDPKTFECLKEIVCWDECEDCVGMCVCVISDKYIACASRCEYDSLLYIWNLETQVCESAFTSHTSRINCIIMADTSKIISGSKDSTIKVWNIETQKCNMTLNNDCSINTIAILSDQQIVSGDQNGKIKIWNLLTEDCILTLDAHNGCVYTIAVFFDGHFISGSIDSTIKVWNKINNKYNLETTLTGLGHTDRITEITILPDDSFIICEDPNILKLWSCESGIYHSVDLQNKEDSDYIFTFPLSGGRIVSGSSEGSLQIWY